MIYYLLSTPLTSPLHKGRTEWCQVTNHHLALVGAAISKYFKKENYDYKDISGLEFIDGKSVVVAACPHNFAPDGLAFKASKREGPLKLCSVDTTEHRQGIRRLDLLVRFGLSQNEHHKVSSKKTLKLS